MTFREQFSDPYPNERFGVITGTFLLSQFPNVYGRLGRLRANSLNGSSIWIGDVQSTGSYPSNPRLPWEMEAGFDTGWFSLNNLNRYFMAGCSGSIYLSYWVQG